MNRAERRRQAKAARKKAKSEPTAAFVDLLQQGLGHHQAGRLAEAESAYREALDADPRNPDGLHLLGMATLQAGRPDKAAELIGEAIEARPEPTFLKNHGIALEELGRLDDAVAAFERSLELRPDDAETWSNLGGALLTQGKIEDAIERYRRAVTLEPRLSGGWFNLGNAYRARREFDQAADAYSRCIEIMPDDAEALCGLGNALFEQGHLTGAASAYERAIAVRPRLADGHSNLGNVLAVQGRYADGIAAFEAALEIDPGFIGAMTNLGNALAAAGRNDDAIRVFERAIEGDPQHADARVWHGKVLDKIGRTEDAFEAFRRALELDPKNNRARAELYDKSQRLCDWTRLADLEADLDAALHPGAGADEVKETPFANICRSEDPAQNLAIAKRWSDIYHQRFPSPFRHLRRRDGGSGKIVLGYLTNDAGDHAVGHLIRGLFALHDHARFEVHLYATGRADGSVYRHDIAAGCDVVRDVEALDHHAAAALIHQDDVDILIDLNGWTEGHRQEVCALGPAPVQVTYLGFPGSTGAGYFDYVIVDEVVAPAADAGMFSENLVAMPDGFMITDASPPAGERTFERREVGLPEAAMVYCSFNQAYKLDPAMFACWMEILGTVPDSVLWLREFGGTVEARLRREAEAAGIAADRLIFAPFVDSKADFIARLRLADIALDTRIYNGHATTVDALAASVPVVTLKGGHFASRVSASCLAAAGLGELVVETIEEYQALAIRLGGDQAARRDLQDRLAGGPDAAPLFETGRFVANLEAAYREMHRRFQVGEAASAIDVAGLD